MDNHGLYKMCCIYVSEGRVVFSRDRIHFWTDTIALLGGSVSGHHIVDLVSNLNMGMKLSLEQAMAMVN